MFLDSPIDGVDILLRHLNGFAGFYMVQAYCRTDTDIRRFAWTLALAGVFPMATGIYEVLTGFHWRVTYGELGVVRNIGLYHDAITIRYYALQTIMGFIAHFRITREKNPCLCVWASSHTASAVVLVIKGAYSKSGIITLTSWIGIVAVAAKGSKDVAFAGDRVGFPLACITPRPIMDSGGFVFLKEIVCGSGHDRSSRNVLRSMVRLGTK